MSSNIQDNQTYKLSNELLNGSHKNGGVEVYDRSGKLVVRKQTTTDFKIVRAIIFKMQQKYKNVTDLDCEIEAVQNLSEKFKERGIYPTYKIKGRNLIFETVDRVRDVMVTEESRRILKTSINPNFEFSVDEIIKIANIKSSNAHYVRKQLASMTSKSFYNTVENKVDENGSIYESGLSFSLVGSIRSERGKIFISVVTDSIPYIFGLTKNYTAVEMLSMSMLNSIYSVILYELLKKNYKIQNRYYYKLEDLNNAFDSTAVFKVLKARILSVAIEELRDKMGMDVEMELKKEGRKVVSIKFIVSNAPFDKNRASNRSENELFAHFIMAKEILVNKLDFVAAKKRVSDCLRLINKNELPSIEIYRKNFEDNKKAIVIINKVLERHNIIHKYFYDEIYFTYLYADGPRIHSCVAVTSLEVLEAIKSLHSDTVGTFIEVEAELSKHRIGEDLEIKEISFAILGLFDSRLFLLDEEKDDVNRGSFLLLSKYSKDHILDVVVWLKSPDGKFDLKNTHDVGTFIKSFQKLSHKCFTDKGDITVKESLEDEAVITKLVEDFKKKLIDIDKYFSTINDVRSKSQIWIDTKLELITIKDKEYLFTSLEKECIAQLTKTWISNNIDSLHYKEATSKIATIIKKANKI